MYLLIGIITGATIMLLWMKNKSTQELRKAGEELAALRSQLETERKNMDERIAAVKESSRNQIETERKHSEELRSELRSRRRRRTGCCRRRCATWLHRCWQRAGRR